MTRQIAEAPDQAYTPDIDYEPSRSFMDRLPLRAGLATLAAAATAGLFAESGSSAERYANTPVGVAREFATLYSQGKYKEACQLDHYNCPDIDKKDGRGYSAFAPVKVFVTKMPEPIHKKVPNATMIEVQTKSYKDNGPWCMIGQKYGGKWQLRWEGWGKPGDTCAAPKVDIPKG